jgi:hypothetical protein
VRKLSPGAAPVQPTSKRTCGKPNGAIIQQHRPVGLKSILLEKTARLRDTARPTDLKPLARV